MIRAHLEAQLHQVRTLDAVAAGLLRPLGKGRSRSYQAGATLYPRIGAGVGVPVSESGDAGRAIIVGELTKRVAAERSLTFP